MKKITVVFILFVGLILACSRDTGGILVKLEQPMFNRFRVSMPHQGGEVMELPKSDITTIFDTEQMTSFEAKIRGGDVTPF